MNGLMFTSVSGDGKRDGAPADRVGEVVKLGGPLPGNDADQEVYDDAYEEEEFYEEEDDEGPAEHMLRHAAEIEAGLVPGWKLDRTHPGVLVWTTPSGRRYESTLDGSICRPFPAGDADLDS